MSQLLKLISKGGLKDAATMLKWATAMSMQFMPGSEKNLKAQRNRSAWEEEREDILERANWLCEQVMVTPEALVKKAPQIIGENFQCQWAIYSCSMLAHGLANISVLYPDKKDKCPELIARLIEIVNTPTIRKYDTVMWHEDAIEGLSGNKHHMTYLSILAWMITNYKMAGGDARYDNLLHSLCEGLHRRMLGSKYDLNLLSFPGKQIWLPDMLVTLVALKNYGRLFDDRYEATVRAWVHNARTKWCHKQTGLLAGMLPGASRYVKGIVMRGSHTGLSCSYLALVDEVFAREQYELMKKHFTLQASVLGKTVTGIKEFQRKVPSLQFMGGDAGFVIKGISAGGTAFALGACTFFEDWDFRYELLRTAEIGGCTVKGENQRHYRLGEFALVGEATTLAMRTQINRYI